MKKCFLFVLILVLFIQCTAVKKHNIRLSTLVPASALQSDVDFTYNKLKKLHPNLYLYISKEKLDYKFDSLKTSITAPMIPLDFYKKLSPVVAAVRQGHSFVYPPSKLLTKKESKALEKKGTGPFSQFDFEFLDNKIYVVKNKSYDQTIKVGSELIRVNDIKPLDLIHEYGNYYSSDGFNTTFKKQSYTQRFTRFFTIENGIKDSLNYVFKHSDSIHNVIIKRFKKDSIKQKNSKSTTKAVTIDHQERKELRRKKRKNGYDKEDNNYTRNLSFLEKDSSTALIKIRGFKNGPYKRFYKESFQKIKDKNTKNVILDLRDNGGGRLSEVNHLYSYLADSTFIFLDKSEVVSKSSLFNGAYFNGGSLPLKMLKAVYAPAVYAYLCLTVRKDNNGMNYFATRTKPQEVEKNAFNGKLYVIINGGSFSASSIISSNLKGSHRATFVGEETGGAFNGTVAGFMPNIKLPQSNLKIRIGLMHIVPHYKTDTKGHGIYPDQEITPTIWDFITNNDPELKWILNDIKEQ